MKTKLIRPVANYVKKRIDAMAQHASTDQDKIFHQLIRKAVHTKFGIDHGFQKAMQYKDYKAQVPLYTYEKLLPYIEAIKSGKRNVLWLGVPVYFAKTSGTTAGAKYIPISKASLPNHVGSARNAFFCFLAKDASSTVLDGKLMFLSGSPELVKISGIPTGRLSGIVNHEIPIWLRGNQVPSYQTNLIEDWEEKLDKIVDETIHEDLRMISGIPPWVKMYYERVLARTGKQSIIEQFPNLQLFIYGGVNFEPYKNTLEQLVGKSLPSIETYPASEGFIAFQDKQGENDLLLNTNSGIFFEFVEVSELEKPEPHRIKLNEVSLDKNYAIIISSNAGLWAYQIGDLIQFKSLNPYKIVVSGRIGQYTSAFGEHVIGFEAERSISEVCTKLNARIEEFMLAPQVNPPEGGKPYHEWFIDFEEGPKNIDQFSIELDLAMQSKNPYYADLRRGNILQKLNIKQLKSHSIRNYLKEHDKLGGQNKVPRLTNDRIIADQLTRFIK